MGRELANKTEDPTSLLLRSANDAAGQLLECSRDFSPEGWRIKEIVGEAQKTGYTTILSLVVDGTGSMRDDVQKVREEVTKFLLTLFPAIQEKAPALFELYGGKFTLGAVCIEFGDIDVPRDYPFFSFTAIEPTEIGQDPEKHPIIQFLENYETSFDGGMHDEESGLDAAVLGLGFDPAEESQGGKPTLGAQLVKAILQMVENERKIKVEKFVSTKHREPREDEITDSITDIYMEVLQYLPPQVLILVTDELARTDYVTFKTLGDALRELQIRPDIIVAVPADETVRDGGKQVNVKEWWKKQVKHLPANSDGKAVPVLDLNTLGSQTVTAGANCMKDNLTERLALAAVLGMERNVKGLLTGS